MNPSENITAAQTKIKLIYIIIFMYILVKIAKMNAIVNNDASAINEIM